MSGIKTGRLSPLFVMQYIKSMHANQPINRDVLAFLQNAVDSYFQGQSLDEAFGVKETGIRSRYQKELRNGFLRIAGRYYIDAAGISQRAAKLDAEIRTFETLIWPSWRGLDDPPSGASLLRIHLFYAKKSCEKMPSYRQLINIL